MIAYSSTHARDFIVGGLWYETTDLEKYKKETFTHAIIVPEINSSLIVTALRK